MSTQTQSPTTRQLANRLLSTLDWLANNQDELPGGWTLKTYPDDGPQDIAWAGTYNDEDGILHALAFLRLHFGPGTRDQSWISWPAEGDRPRLTVYLGGVA